ncbi:MAG: TlpA family protein disulfide reductase [Oscillospiraceae bacterium]|nr:TlpA family protein disulfide reductase [Oscillospiraceae bacterium]
MKKSTTQKAYKALYIALICVWVMLVAAVLVLLAYTLLRPVVKSTPKAAASAVPVLQAAPTPAPLPAAALTQREDFMPDVSAYYRLWDLPLQDAQGNALPGDAFRGAPLALLYWASWCPDCGAMMDTVEAMAEAAEGMGARFELAVRTGVRDETAQTAADALAKAGIDRTTWLDADAALYSAMGLKQVPTLLFFSEDGRLMTAMTGNFTPERVKAAITYAQSGGAAETWSFIDRALVDARGGIPASFALDAQGQATPQQVWLSESTGLAMQHALTIGDQALFDRLYDFLRPDVLRGRVPWRWEATTPSDTNALVDDLRLLKALIEAQTAWGGYQEDIDTLAAVLKKECAPNQQLVDIQTKSGSANTLTLCYVDVNTLTALSQQDAAWADIADRAMAILVDGRISEAFPLYAARYSYKAQAYEPAEFLQMNEAMVTIYHLAAAGMLPEDTQAFLREWLAREPIYAAYDGYGRVVTGYAYESTATYGLLVMTGCALDDQEMTRLALARMEQTRVIDGASPANGAYAYPGQENATFDTLIALLAWDAVSAR